MRRHMLAGILVIALAAAGCQASDAAELVDTAPVTSLPPVATTTSTPPTTTTTVPTSTTTTTFAPIPTPRGRLVISGTGDVNLDPKFVRSFPRTGYEEAWSGLFGAFLRDDLTVVNLECSPAPGTAAWDKPYNFACDPAAYASMEAAGVDVANLANNHAMDYGFDAMLEGKALLTAAGVSPVGTGENYDEAYTPVMVERNGWTIAVIGSGGVNPETGSWLALDDRPGMTHGDDTESIAEAIRAAKETADIVIVTAHWGEQGTTQPRSFERRQAEAWIDAGADGVFGHHQHRLQPLEFYQGKPIAWGLGNFVWQAYGPGRTTAIAQFVYEPDGRIGACLVPVYIERTGHPVIQDPTAPVCAPDGGR